MVNAEKHKKITAKFGMLPIDNKELMHNFNAKIIYTANEDSEHLIGVLNELHDELTRYYDWFGKTNCGVLKLNVCQRILEVFEWAFVIKNTIQYNYHMLRIDADVIKSILSECDGVLNEFKAIQERQNKNIDNKTYGGFYGVASSETLDIGADYPLENFESIVRLKEPLNLVGADGLM